jgi:hypothetical protein
MGQGSMDTDTVSSKKASFAKLIPVHRIDNIERHTEAKDVAAPLFLTYQPSLYTPYHKCSSHTLQMRGKKHQYVEYVQVLHGGAETSVRTGEG